MLFANALFTSESVSAGHPDKLCDRISDAILDEFLKRDPKSRVACETFAASGRIVVAGEFRTTRTSDFLAVKREAKDLVRRTLREIGYGHAAQDIDPDTCEVDIRFNRQSAEIAGGVDRADGVQGAGDQGLMFGYAARESESLMPLPIHLAHQLVHALEVARVSRRLPFLRPDAKTQVSLRYVEGRPGPVEAIVVSTQHEASVSLEHLQQAVREEIIDRVIPASQRSANCRILVNPAGTFTVGGPLGDTGLTGRKIIVDTYGGACPHGGGAFSGKDASKVDRSAAYMARFLAKHAVAAGIAERCTVQLAYAIGEAEPVSVAVDFQGTGVREEEAVAQALRELFNLTPAGIIRTLNLTRPIFSQTAAGGHFGRELPDFTWEQSPKAGELADRLNHGN